MPLLVFTQSNGIVHSMNVSVATILAWLILGQTIWLLGCGPTAAPPSQRSDPFVSEQWQSEDPMKKIGSRARHDMLRDLIDIHLPGRDRSEVREMLGGAEYSNGELNCYMTGAMASEYFPTPEGECLCVIYDSNGVVSGTPVGECP
jgi:hypothetical protein